MFCNFNLTNKVSQAAIEDGVEKAAYKATSLLVIKDADMSEYEKVMIASLQGLVANKTTTQIYIDPEGGQYDTWLADLNVNYGVTYSYVTNPWDLVNYYQSYIDGYLLWSVGNDSINVATSLAYSQNAILVENNIKTVADTNGLAMKMDVRDKNEQWVLNNYWNVLNHNLLVEQKETLGGTGIERKDHKLRDYAVMANAFTFYDGNSTWRNTVMNSVEADALLLGWGDATNGEDQFINTSSLAGVSTLPADHAYNMSTLSGFSKETLTQKAYTAPVVEEDIHYVTFVMSDGDNIQWLLGDFNNDTGRDDWYGNANRGNFSMGWGMAPAMIEIAPTVMKYYYDQASSGTNKDNFIVGPSGSGYMYPSKYPTAELDSHLTELNEYMGKTDLSIVEIIDFNSFNNIGLWDKYTAESNIDGLIYLEYTDHSAQKGAVNWSNGKPVIAPRSVLWEGVTGGSNQEVINTINAAERNPYSTAGYSIVLVHAWSKSMDDIQAVVNGLSSDVRVVTPEEMVTLMTDNCEPNNDDTVYDYKYEAETDFGHNVGRLDGDGWSANTSQDGTGHMMFGPAVSNIATANYDVNFRMMVDQNTGSSNRVVNLDIYDQTTATVVGDLAVYNTDFTYANAYQRFTINANLILGHSYEFRVYYDDKTYVKVDYVGLKSNTYLYEAETAFGHNVGRLDGDGWSANTTQDGTGHMMYGPSVSSLDTGNYNIGFKMMIDNNTATNVRVVNLDIYNQTTNTVVGELAVNRRDFTSANTYQYFTINTNLNLGHSYEFRVYYDDKSYVKVDHVKLTRVN